jgi:hypothetical protein
MKFIAYELAFDRQLIAPFEPTSSTIIMTKPNDYCEKANRFRAIAIKAARANIQIAQSNSRRRYDRNRQNSMCKPGDLV